MMKKLKTNICPNCGAAIPRDKCDYCGTRILDVTALDVDSDKPFWLRFHHNGKIANIKIMTLIADPREPVIEEGE